MNAFVLAPLLLLSFIKVSRCDCVIDNRSLSQEWEKKLHDDLMCNYHWYDSPNMDNVTEVKVWFHIKYFELDNEDLFCMHSWMSVHWTDKRLIWDPSKYGGIDRTIMYSSELWTPDIVLNNRQHDYISSTFFGECTISKRGAVVCVSRLVDSAQCRTNLAKWPYDIQRCTLEYGISDLQKNVHLKAQTEHSVTVTGAEYGSEWTIVDYNQTNNISDISQLKITFVLERNGDAVGAAIICPSILLSILLIASILLDVADENRLLMLIFGVMCHCMYLIEIGWEVPKHSEDIPSILLFYRFSIVSNICLVVLTVGLQKLRNKESVPPSWVINVSKIVTGSYGKYFLWPRWETDAQLLTSDAVKLEDVEAWNVLANTFNSAYFFITVLVYSIMIPVYIPRSEGLAEKLKKDSFIFKD